MYISVDPKIVDITMILNVKVSISVRYDININVVAFCILINSAQFSHLSSSITPGNHQWRGAAPLFNRRGVQMIIGAYGFLSNVNRFSVKVFITTMNSSDAEASTCTVKCFNEASVLYTFLTLDIGRMNDIRLISRPIHVPNHELEDTNTNTPLIKVISKTIVQPALVDAW